MLMPDATHYRGTGLVAFLLRAWSSRGAARQQRALRVVESTSLGGRKQIHVLSYAGRTYLVGTGADTVQCICPLNARVEGTPGATS